MESVTNRCQFTPWTVEQLVAGYTGKASPRFVLPSFQRDFVWKVDDQKRFVESVRDDLPVGCILLFAPPDENNVRYIVDGLQRCTTLAKYANARFEHFGAEDVPEPELAAVLAATVPGFAQIKQVEKDAASASLRSYIISFMRRRRSFAIAEGYEPYNLYEGLKGRALGNYAITSAFAGAIPGALGALLDSIRTRLSIDDAQIPVIEFFGEREHLPTIFERLNSEGTKLNKYDVLAAQWSEATVTFSQKEIANQVKGRYSELIELGLEYKGGSQLGDLSAGKEFLIYEFVVGLGRSLKQRFPRLYRPLKKSTEVESIGFNLATLTVGLPIAELGKLRSWLWAAFADGPKDVPDVTPFADLLFAASEHVNEWLAPALESPLFKRKWKSPHSEFQIAAMVATVARALIGSEKPFLRRSANSELDALSETIPQHYWLELLSAQWKGSGDSRAFGRVKDRAYFETVEKEQLADRLQAWNEGAMVVKQKRVKDKSLDPVTRGLIALAAGFVGIAGFVDEKTTLEPIYDDLDNVYVLGNLRLVHGGEDLFAAVGAPKVNPDVPVQTFVRDRFDWLSERIIAALYESAEVARAS